MHVIPTVGDLIKELQELPKDLPIYMNFNDNIFSLFMIGVKENDSHPIAVIYPDHSTF